LELELYEDAVRTLKEAAEIHEGSNTIRQLLNEANTSLRISKQKDYYKVLGVSRDADERDIKRAYRKLVKEHHPDKSAAKGVPKEVAQAKIAAINEAYETLKDPELKARVDRGEDPNDPQQQQGGHPFHGSPFGHGGGGQQFVFRSGPGGFGGGSDGGFQFQFPGGFGG
jgi:DnaJ family protein C protein 3